MVRFQSFKDSENQKIPVFQVMEKLKEFEITVLHPNGYKFERLDYGPNNYIHSMIVQLKSTPQEYHCRLGGESVFERNGFKYCKHTPGDEPNKIRKNRFMQFKDWVFFNDAINKFFDSLGWSGVISSKFITIRKVKESDWRPAWNEFLEKNEEFLSKKSAYGRFAISPREYYI